MDRVVLFTLLLLCAPSKKGSRLGHAWSLGRQNSLPLEPDSAWSNSCSPPDCSLPGRPLGDRLFFQTYKPEVFNRTCSESESDWRFYVFVIFVVVGSLCFLCLRPPVRKCLVSIRNHIWGLNRNNLRNSHCSRTRPRNYGSLMETAFQSPDPKAAEGHAGSEDSQRGCDGAPKTETDDCGDTTSPGAASEATVEVDDTVWVVGPPANL